ncbi:MAG: DMT family transporter [Planctomycetota bacterium]
MKLIFLVALSLVAFAANSILCRMALREAVIDATSFTTLRLASGALALWLIELLLRERNPSTATSDDAMADEATPWAMSVALFAYAILFSIAYNWLNAATGALALFGSVQVTMLIFSRFRGEPTQWMQWVGFGLSNAGLVYLFLPNVEAPNPVGLLLMCLSGMAWGVYSALGRGARKPIIATSRNFRRSLILAIPLSLCMFGMAKFEIQGLLLAAVSGSITSGIGYVIWYRALPNLSTLQASIAQLLVPIIAALGGILFLKEEMTSRLIIAGLLILGGIALPFARRPKLAFKLS